MARSNTVRDATPTPSDAYLEALATLENIRRTSDADEPGREDVEAKIKGEDVIYTRITPSPLQAAEAAVRAARAALEAHGGPTAVRLADAQHQQSRVDAELTKAQHSPLAFGSGTQLAALIGRQRAAQVAVEKLTEAAAVERARAEDRERLEAEQAPLLAEVDADLGAARARLTAAAEAAQGALAALLTETAVYWAHTRQARATLVGAGFDASTRFDGSAYPTSLGAELHVAGVWWPEVEPLAALARVVHRVVRGTGQRGRVMSGILGSFSFPSARKVDALFADVAEPVVPAGELVAQPTVPALRDWANLPEPATADRSGYIGPDKARPRRLGRLGSR